MEREREFIIKNRYGLHVRPSTAIAKEVRKYKSKVSLTYKDETIDAMQIMSILSLGVSHKDKVKFKAIGEDSLEVLDAIEKLVDTFFGIKDEYEGD